MSESTLAPGLLVAMPQLLDPNFQRAVVLVIHHDRSGSFGVVLNRSTDLTAPALCATLAIDWRGDPEREIHWGGPVQPHTGWLLYGVAEGRDPGEGVTQIRPGLCFAGSLDVLREIASDPPERVRVLLGYAGWGPGQLESELSEGAWITAPVSEETVFDVEPAAMWEHVVRGLGIEPATLVATRGIH
ncbi:MAG TPA: YqgE/AlgH family protein [Myxococcota bacterium]|nr:YqgE/AlgH family protein [Myxococcota bacterium]